MKLSAKRFGFLLSLLPLALFAESQIDDFDLDAIPYFQEKKAVVAPAEDAIKSEVQSPKTSTKAEKRKSSATAGAKPTEQKPVLKGAMPAQTAQAAPKSEKEKPVEKKGKSGNSKFSKMYDIADEE